MKKDRKHMTFEDRLNIEKGLNQLESFKKIASTIGKHPSTVSREVKNRLIYRRTGSYGYAFNECLHRYDCSNTKIKSCKIDNCNNNKCSKCKYCNKFCADFEKEICNRKLNGIHICNGCEKYRKCSLTKVIYQAKEAQREYKEVLSELREGISLSEEELEIMNEILEDGISRGHSFYSISNSNKDLFMISESSLYRYQEKGILATKNIDLPMKVKVKKRKKRKDYKIDKTCRINRSYDDFQMFLYENPDTIVAEMDTVVGRKGGKTILTICFRGSNLLLAYLLKRNKAKYVTDKINTIYNDLGKTNFTSLFPVILEDNGPEFSNPNAIEKDTNGNKRTNVFYCNPYSSYQKPHVENIHTMLRKVLPKGTSFDNLNQNQLYEIINSINSYPRKNLAGMTPYEIFLKTHGIDIVKKLKLQPIPNKDILLIPLK